MKSLPQEAPWSGPCDVASFGSQVLRQDSRGSLLSEEVSLRGPGKSPLFTLAPVSAVWDAVKGMRVESTTPVLS